MFSRPPAPGTDARHAFAEPVAETIARVRSRSFAAVRLFGTVLGVPNAMVTLLVAWLGGALTPAVALFVGVQVALIACAWTLRSRLDRVGGILIVAAATVLGLGNLWVWGFTVGFGLMVAWACVACATFYGVRAGLAAWVIAAVTLAGYIGLRHAGLVPAPAGIGAVSAATPLLVRYAVTIVAVTGILVMMMAALVEGFERATHSLADAAARERDERTHRLESERRAAAHLLEAQARSYSLLHAAMEATADGLLIVDCDGTVRGANQRFYEMWRIPPPTPADAGDAQLLDAVAAQLADPDGFRDKVRDLYARPLAESRDVVTFTDGRVFERVSRPQFLAEVPVGRVWSFRDVTDARQQEARLWQAQKMEAIGVLASGIAHEFSNLLTVIGGRAGLIRRQVSHGDPARSDADALIAAADRASALTRHLAAFSRRQVLQPRVLDVNQVVTGLMELMVPLVGERITCDVRLAGDVWPVCVDPAQMEQALLRLVVNARDAMMPGGGHIVIESRNVWLQAGDPRLQGDLMPGAHVHLAVIDSGPGLDADAQARAFEPFFVPRAGGHEAGAGLALAMVHGIVGQSGGHISVSSDPLQGRTTFDILLPRAGAPVPTPAAPQPAGIAAEQAPLL